MLLAGSGCERDADAAQVGLWLAAHNLAVALMSGAEGVEQDLEQARKYLALAAELASSYVNWMGLTG